MIQPSHLTSMTLKPLGGASISVLVNPSICPYHKVLISWNACVSMCLQSTPCPFVTSLVNSSSCLSPHVSPPPPHVLLPLTETLASAKEENVEIHQTLDQTLLELNNL